MTLVQFIYKTILLLFVLHTTVKLHTIIMNLLPLIYLLFVVLLASYQHGLCWFDKDEGENPDLKREHMQGRTPFCHQGVIMKMKMSTKGPYESLPPDICTETSRLDSPVSDSTLPTCKASTLLARPEGTIHHTQQQQLQLTDTDDQKQNQLCT